MPTAFADGWKVSVLEWSEAPRYPVSEGWIVGPGLRLLSVLLRFDNQSIGGEGFSAHDFRLQDSTGVRRQQPSSLWWPRSDALVGGTLVPGSFVVGSIFFAVPKAETGPFQLTYARDDRHASWTLGH